jgi:hypothetical protein
LETLIQEENIAGRSSIPVEDLTQEFDHATQPSQSYFLNPSSGLHPSFGSESISPIIVHFAK